MAVYRFGSFILDVSDRWLKRNGRLLVIPEKLFDILTLLVENSSRVVPKEELMLKIWADAAVEDSNLTVSISRIRKILREERDADRKYILTFPRRGYRFIAAVRRIQDDAVLSVACNFNECREENYGDLASFPLQLTTNNNSFYFPSVQRMANASECLNPVMFPKTEPAALAYLNGRYCWSRHTKEGIESAIEYFRKTLADDPEFLPAYAALVDCYLRLTTNYFLPAEANQRRK